MKNHARVNRLIEEAMAERRCAFSPIESENAALRRRVAEDGGLLRPARGLYVPSDYWNGLDPFERSMHMARAMQGNTRSGCSLETSPRRLMVSNIPGNCTTAPFPSRAPITTASAESRRFAVCIFRSNACQWRWLTGCLFLTKYVQC